MRSLAISLGHNSSAVLIEDGQIVAGYEEERFSEQKSDSRFPISALNHLKLSYDLSKNIDVYVGHWFTDAMLPAAPNKYWRPDVLKLLFPDCKVHSLSREVTHHDSHLLSAMVFAGDDFADNYLAVVADGFGSFGECITVYDVTKGGKYRILHRVFGFEKSMGMLYQYATAFMGMKMHNHEYKILAYEVHIGEVLDDHEIDILDGLAHESARQYLKAHRNGVLSNEFDPFVDVSALPNVQAQINDMLTNVLKNFDYDERDLRVIISYFVQRVVESVMITTIGLYSPKNLLVAGGLFYNVKLNHILADTLPEGGRFCAMPLAGDQGAAIGVYESYRGDLKWPGHLAWGHRNLDTMMMPPMRGLQTVKPDQAYERIAEKLSGGGWVNIVRDSMEFGPRSLCNTATLAIPSMENVERINRANDRTAEMPFAPVMTQAQAREYFHNIGKVHKSLEYMVVARAYKAAHVEDVLGAAHWYPDMGIHTGRPQITSDPLMTALLNEFGPLVNTSFNFHGVPIVRDVHQVMKTHKKQCETAPDLNPTTIIIN